jgi:hypothetical protein
VDKILDHKSVKGKQYYRVLWEGGAKTFEPEENILSEQLIKRLFRKAKEFGDGSKETPLEGGAELSIQLDRRGITTHTHRTPDCCAFLWNIGKMGINYEV